VQLFMPDEINTPTKPIRILSIDGGGIGGIMPSFLLARLVQDWPLIIEHTDIFAGTSTGGLIALGLADGRTPDYLANLYIEQAPTIFKRSLARIGLLDLWWAKYSANALRGVLMSQFGDKTLGALAKPVVVPTVALVRPDGKHTPAGIFLSTIAQKAGMPGLTKYHSDEWLCVDAGLATSAAPTYFPAHQVGGWVLWDGGLVANNPAAVSLGEAKKVYHSQAVEYTILSLGTGYGNYPTQAGDWGKIRAVKDIIATTLDTSVGSTAFLLRQDMGNRFLRLNLMVPDYELDDPTAILGLRDEVDKFYNATKTFSQTDGTDVDALEWLRQNW
jgi:patatin-like phospholipase/acyl hydrolase